MFRFRLQAIKANGAYYEAYKECTAPSSNPKLNPVSHHCSLECEMLPITSDSFFHSSTL